MCLEGAGGRLCEEGVGVAPQQVGGEGEGQGQAVHSGGQCDGRHLGKGSCYEGYVMTLLLRLPLCLKDLLRIFATRSPGQDLEQILSAKESHSHDTRCGRQYSLVFTFISVSRFVSRRWPPLLASLLWSVPGATESPARNRLVRPPALCNEGRC